MTVSDIDASKPIPSIFDGWKPYILADSLYKTLMVAKDLAAGAAPVPWKDENGVLTAKQACVEFRDGGYTDWRLPRISELFIVGYNANVSGVGKNANQLWSGTEYDADNSYATGSYPNTTTIFPKITSKKESLYVRCVRDADKPKPAK